jgi:hypothetical protein
VGASVMEQRCAIGLAQTPRRTWKGGCLPAERGRLQIVRICLAGPATDKTHNIKNEEGVRGIWMQ